jgi:hypothetical protein
MENHEFPAIHLIRLLTCHKKCVKPKNLILQNVYCSFRNPFSIIKLLLKIIRSKKKKTISTPSYCGVQRYEMAK